MDKYLILKLFSILFLCTGVLLLGISALNFVDIIKEFFSALILKISISSLLDL